MPQRKGFALMTPEKRREIAAKGGASVPANRRAYARDPNLAAAAGRKGGLAKAGKRRERAAHDQ